MWDGRRGEQMTLGQHGALKMKTKQRNYDTNKIAFFYTPGVYTFRPNSIHPIEVTVSSPNHSFANVLKYLTFSFYKI